MWHGSWLGFTLCANAKLSQVKPQYFLVMVHWEFSLVLNVFILSTSYVPPLHVDEAGLNITKKLDIHSSIFFHWRNMKVYL